MAKLIRGYNSSVKFNWMEFRNFILHFSHRAQSSPPQEAQPRFSSILAQNLGLLGDVR